MWNKNGVFRSRVISNIFNGTFIKERVYKEFRGVPIALFFFFFPIFTFLLDLVGESMGHLKFVMNLSMNSDNVFAPPDFLFLYHQIILFFTSLIIC